jgi:hypothetical protein
MAWNPPSRHRRLAVTAWSHLFIVKTTIVFVLYFIMQNMPGVANWWIFVYFLQKNFVF